MPNSQNNIELLVKLGIDKSNKTDLQTQVDTLGKSLAGLKVNINIDQKAIQALERLSTMDFSKLASSAKKATDEISKSTVKSAEEAEKIMKETFGQKIPKAMEKGFSGTAADISKQLKSLGFENIKVGFDVKDGKKQMDKLVASVEKDGVTKTVQFKQAIIADNNKNSQLWMPDKVVDNDKTTAIAKKNVQDLTKEVMSLHQQGKLSTEQFKMMTAAIKGTGKAGGLDRANEQLNQMVANNKRAEQAQKAQVAESKRQEEAQKKLIENEIKRKNLVLDIEKAMKSQTKNIDQTVARRLIEETKQLDVSSKNFTTSLRQNQSALRELNTNATTATRSNMGLISSFKTAMEKFPIWMAASTIFYSVTRGATDLTRKVIELDTALVNLQRVMDMPEYKFNDMLEQSMVNVENLSGKLSDYLNLVTEFGRMGFNSMETLDMSNTAQMLANISDLKSDESVSSLVAAMTAFNITAEDSISIADKLNQVDNEYSITTKDLALSMNKSAATAKVFGASLDQLLGYTTAIGSATRESGNVVGNSLKTLMSRITTLPQAADALNEIGISVTDMGGEIKPVSDIIDEIAKKWHTLSAAEQQNTAVKVAGTFQLSRFNALMLNYQTAVDATTTSINSQGSATREQEKYNKSLEARINRLSTAWYGLADSVGQSILYDGIVVLTSAFEGVTKSGESAVASFGALPIVFGVIGSSVALLSTRFSTWTGTMIASKAASMATTATNGSLSASFLGLAATSTVAQRALMMTGVGIALVAVASAVALLTSVVSKHIQEQEEFELYMRKNTDALGLNREATEELIKQYNDLTKAKEEGTWDSEKEEEYLAVQQKLGEFFPSLIKSIDSTGQSHIKSKEAIEAEIKATEDLIAAQNKLTIEGSSKEFEKLNEELSGSWYESFSNYIYGSLESRINQQKSILKTMYKNDADSGAIAEAELKLKQLERQYQQTSEKIKGHIFTVADAMSSIKISSNLSNMLQEFIGGLDLSKLDSTQLETFAKEIGSIQIELQEAINSGDTSAFDAVIVRLNSLVKDTNNFDAEYNSLNSTLENGNITLKDSAGIIHILGENSEETAEKTDKLSEAFDAAVSSISSLNSIVNELNEGNGLSAKSLQTMMEKYPQLLMYMDDEALLREKISELISEEEYLAKKSMIAKLSNNKEAYQKMYKDNEDYFKKLKNEYDVDFKNFKSLAQAKMVAENAVMSKLSQNWSKYYNAQANALTEQGEAYFKNMSYGEAVATGNGSYNGKDAEFLRQFAKQKEATKGIADAFNEMALTSFGVDSLGLSTEGLSKSTDKSTKATKESTYITDKYKQAIEAVNLEIEKQQKLRSNMTDFSKQYRDSLQTEINLEKQKSKLMEDQAASLQSQIKSGKVIQTGKSTSSSNQKLNGWSGQVTSNYGTRKDPFTGKSTRHDGVDIAGSKGQRLDSNVNGKVVFAGKGTGSSAGLGNYVTIQAEDGMKHIYAHLDKVVATLGQTITTGMQIGNIGSTGRSTGNHLHYQTKDASGKTVDPTSYLQSAKGGGDLANSASNAQQAIDQAKSDLNGLQSSIMQSQEKIAKLEIDIINSQLSEFDNTRNMYQHTLDYENAKQDAISQTGKEYRASIDKQITAMNGQQTANQAELKFLENLIANGKLSSLAMNEMKEKVKALKTEMLQLGTAIEAANFEKITSRMKAFDESQDDLQYIVDLTGEYMGALTEGSEEYNKAAKEQIAAMQKQQRMLRTQIDEHKNDLATKKLGVQETKDLKEKIEDLTIAYYSLGNGIKSSTESLVEANKRMAEEVADKLINSYKDYHSERRDAHMKTLDAEAKAEDKRHKQISDNLSKELDAYKKIIQAKLDMLDKEESERDYNKEIDELEKTRLETLDKINLLSLDDSFEARKEVANLTEKLNATEEQIAEKRHDREIELRKENLNDLLTSKEEDVKNRQELEDQRYEHEKELIDKQKEYWEQYYNDLLNDERKFAKLRKDIVAGNTSEINAEFGKILDYFKETMPELENTLDGTMTAVGTSIRKNMIDSLQEALDLMSQLGKNTSIPSIDNGQFQSDKNNANVSAKPKPTPSGNGGQATGLGEITIEKPINLWKREGDKLVHDKGRILKPGDKFRVYGQDDKFGGQFNVGGGNWVTNIPGYVKYKKFDTGGYTKNGEGLAMLHEKEIVLNKDDTKNFLKGIDILRTLDSLINPLKMPSVKPPQLAGATSGGDINIEFHVENMNGTQKEADSFSKRIGDNLKRLKGLK